nr:MAG TPA: hypothetical protein [Caudoviricetes sp.]
MYHFDFCQKSAPPIALFYLYFATGSALFTNQLNGKRLLSFSLY